MQKQNIMSSNNCSHKITICIDPSDNQLSNNSLNESKTNVTNEPTFKTSKSNYSIKDNHLSTIYSEPRSTSNSPPLIRKSTNNLQKSMHNDPTKNSNYFNQKKSPTRMCHYCNNNQKSDYWNHLPVEIETQLTDNDDGDYSEVQNIKNIRTINKTKQAVAYDQNPINDNVNIYKSNDKLDIYTGNEIEDHWSVEVKDNKPILHMTTPHVPGTTKFIYIEHGSNYKPQFH